MQLDFFDIPSPCIGICQTDEKGLCKGCMRSRDERQEWKHFTHDEKQKVIKRCIQRTKRKNKPAKSKVAVAPVDMIEPESKQRSLLVPESKAKPCTKDDLDFGDFEL